MSYTIKVLTSEEFDKLPYEHAPRALGLADVHKNEVYVRNTNIKELNEYLLDHEVNHLVEEHATDDIDGIRYKIPILGPIASGIGSLASSALPAIGSGISSLGSGLLGAGKAAAGGIGSLASGAFNLGKSAIGGVGSALGAGANAIGNAFQSNSFGGGSRGSGFGGGFGSSFGSALGRQAGQSLSNLFGSKMGGGFGGALNSAFDPKSLIGGGLLGVGLNKNLPNVPPLPQSAENLSNRVNAGGGPLGQQAKGVLSGQLNQQFDPLSEPEIQASLRQLESDQLKAEDQVRDLYRNLRPGTDPSTDSSFRRDLAEVQDQFARAKSDTLATRTRDVKARFDQQKYLQVQQALGADDQEMQQLSAIAQMDINQIMAQLGIDYASAQHFKETFTNLGANLLTQGLGGVPQGQSAINFNFGGNP